MLGYHTGATARAAHDCACQCVVADPGRPDGRWAFLDELRALGRAESGAFAPTRVDAAELGAFQLGAGLAAATIGIWDETGPG